MASSLKWDHDLATSAVSSIDAASDSISGDSVESPSGCGYSASAASAVVTRLQTALSGLQSGIPSLATSLRAVDTSITTADTNSASTVPSWSSVAPGLMTGSGPLVGDGGSAGSSSPSGGAAGGVRPQYSTTPTSSNPSGATYSSTRPGPAVRAPYPGMSSNPNGR